jgi:hypothetical protein
MSRIQNLFLLLVVIGPLHMAEQLVTGIEEFHSIQRLVAGYYAWFPIAAADHASVLLITIVWTICSLMLYAVLREGTPRLVVMGVLGVFGATEVHHVVESFARGGYDPGVITCIPYAIVGFLLVKAVWREFQRDRGAVAGVRDLAVAGQ